jgi:hypothetical protein
LYVSFQSNELISSSNYLFNIKLADWILGVAFMEILKHLR